MLTPPACSAPLSPQDSTIGRPSWEYSATLYAYWFPQEDFFGLPIVTGDHGHLHVEGRYNYEDLKTLSLFAGWNFFFSPGPEIRLSPMIGAVAGRTNGVAPGLEADILYEILELYAEWEYLFNIEDHTGNFSYLWSELTVSPADWFYAGFVAQRTRVYATELEVSRGVLAGVGWDIVTASLYVLDTGGVHPLWIFALSAEW